MNYQIQRTDNQYKIKEIRTEQNIRTFNTYNDAKSFMKGLNQGKGFCGWTPSFILSEIKFTKKVETPKKQNNKKHK